MNKLYIVTILLILTGAAALFAQENNAEETDTNEQMNRLNISFSSEEFFLNEYQKAHSLYQNGMTIFWIGIALTSATSVLGSISLTLTNIEAIDPNVGQVISSTGFALAGASTLLSVAGATAWWSGSNRILSLVESRDRLFTER